MAPIIETLAVVFGMESVGIDVVIGGDGDVVIGGNVSDETLG